MDTRDYHAERTEYQEQYPQDPTGYYRATLNSLVDDLLAIQAGDYSRFDYQSFDAHLHEAGADAVGYMVELYGYMRSRLVDTFASGLFCLDAMPGGTLDHQRARGFVHNILDELQHTPTEPLTPDDPKAIHFEIGLLLFECVRKRISDGAIEAVAAVAAVADVSTGDVIELCADSTSILQAMDAAGEPQIKKEIVKLTGITLPTVRGRLSELVRDGYAYSIVPNGRSGFTLTKKGVSYLKGKGYCKE